MPQEVNPSQLLSLENLAACCNDQSFPSNDNYDIFSLTTQIVS